MKNHFLTIWILSVVPLFMLGAEIGTPLLAQTSDTVVAKVNGRSITLKEVDSSITSQLFPLEQKIYAIRKAALENLMLRVLLEHEAMRLGISVEELRRRMTAGKVEVAPSQVNELYSENASVFAAMSPDEAKERLRLDLESQARMVNYRKALESWKKSSNVQMLLDEPTLTTPNAESGPSIGSKEAAVTIIEFSDFQCPYCRTSQGALKEVLKSYGSAVRIVFKHMPLDIHSEAFAAAQAAFCAGEQGSFWQYHDALFDSQAFSQKAFDKMASDLGLNLAKFQGCMLSEASRVAIRKDIEEAKQLGITSTPTFIINGNLVRGAMGLEEFKTIIDRQAKSAKRVNHAQ